MHRFTLPTIVAAVLAVGGCAGPVGYSATISSEGYGPDLVDVAPGVQVIADYDVPIFFADGFYWRLDAGRWYRSSYYSGGWVFWTPPLAVMRIERPHEYIHYRPTGWVDRRRNARPPPIVRDHREERPRIENPRRPSPPPPRSGPPPRSEPPPRSPPPPRDHRRDQRDHRR